jgi:hypothetical protein
MDLQSSQSVFGSLSSANATTAAVVDLTDGDGNAIALAPNHRVVITDIVIVVGADMRVDLFNDINDDGNVAAGERLIGGALAANEPLTMSFVNTPRYCRRGLVPKVKTSTAGQVDVTFTARLYIA